MLEVVTIYERFSNRTLFSALIEVAEDDDPGKKHGKAVLWALQNGVDLEGANFGKADLRGADLSGVNLRFCVMGGVHLSGANLSGAHLDNVTLSGANLTDANLTGAKLTQTSLVGANFDGALLANTDLTGSYIFGADFGTAKFSNVTIAADVVINAAPVQVSGIGTRQLLIFDTHMRLDAWQLPLREWAALPKSVEAEIDAKRGAGFWATNRDWILALAQAQGRSIA